MVWNSAFKPCSVQLHLWLSVGGLMWEHSPSETKTMLATMFLEDLGFNALLWYQSSALVVDSNIHKPWHCIKSHE